MDMADEMHVGGKFGQHAFAAVGAVAADQDVASGNHEATKEISSTASWGRVRWLGLGLVLLVLVWFFLPLVSPWRLR